MRLLFLLLFFFINGLQGTVLFKSASLEKDLEKSFLLIKISSDESLQKNDISVVSNDNLIYEFNLVNDDLRNNLIMHNYEILIYLPSTQQNFLDFSLFIDDFQKKFLVDLSGNTLVFSINDSLASEALFPAEKITTVWSVAKSLSIDDVSIHQVMWALYLSNENAFIDKNIHQVRGDLDLRIPAEDFIKNIDASFAKSSILSMGKNNKNTDSQLLKLVSPTDMIKGNREDQLSVQNDAIDLMDNSPSSIIEKQTKVIDISVDESPNFPMQKPSEDHSIQFSFVELIIAIGLALVVGFIGALFLINRKTIKFDVDDMPQDYSKTMPEGLSVSNDILIQKFDLARSLLEMGELNQGSKLLNEIISKSKDTDLIDQVQLLKNKFLEK
ncbi:hypothetical protein N9V24_03280 [Pseudomonadota bacterium]|nr:hypothetical protein [Pseudomonadota bacterium]